MDSPLLRKLANKVPEVTVYFWITKVLTTGMGETFSDYLVHRLDPLIAVALGAIGFTVSLILQFSVKKYVAWVYWLAVAMVSVFGTMAADGLHVQLGVPYLDSTIFFLVVLAAIFIVWYAYEKTLSIHNINTKRREIFYWLTVLTTFALGTAAGDMTASTLHLGYLVSGIVFAAIMLIPTVARKGFGVNEVFTFWFAYIITRPLGASLADWLAVSHARGGLALGDGLVSSGLAIMIFGFVGYQAIARKNN